MIFENSDDSDECDKVKSLWILLANTNGIACITKKFIDCHEQKEEEERVISFFQGVGRRGFLQLTNKYERYGK